MIQYRYDPDSLKLFSIHCLQKQGMRFEDAEIVSDCLVQTDKWGIHSHGLKNLYSYILKNANGGVSFSANPIVVKELPSMAIIDGNNAMGFVSSTFAMRMACRMAENNGVGMTVVKNSCHFGAAGYYAHIAAVKNMIGGAFSNVDAFMTIPGALRAVMGQNPLSLAAPSSVVPSLILDIATSNVASLKVINARNEGKTIPDTWIIDKNGYPTNDPSKYPEEGALQPMAAHKGYGIALFIEIITSVISGGILSMSASIPSWNLKLSEPNGVSHSFIAVNPDRMMGEGYLKNRVDEVIRLIHEAPRVEGVEELTVPGERMWAKSRSADINGLLLPDYVLKELRSLSEYSKVLLPDPIHQEGT